MATKLVSAALEQSGWDRNAVAVTLYFRGAPTGAAVRAACQTAGLALTADTADPHFTYREVPTPASRRAGLVRVQCSPCG